MKNKICLLILAALFTGQMDAQEVGATAARSSTHPVTVFRVLSESTVQQKDGSTITFRKVVPPTIAPGTQPAAAPSPPAAEEEALNQLPVKESKMLSISASVHAKGITVLRWTCGDSQRLQAVSNVDFRCLAGLVSLEMAQASCFIILSAGLEDQTLTDAEALAAQSLPLNSRASVALLNGGAAMSQSDVLALDAMESLLEYFDSHRVELVKQQAQREAERVAREFAERNAPPPPPRHSVIHFWPLQPEQRAAIHAQLQRETAIKAAAQQDAQRVIKGGVQP